MLRPTRLSDLTGIPDPASAPATIRFPAMLVSTFERLRRSSYPGGRSHERGGTIVANGDGELSIQNVGGLNSWSDAFLPDRTIRDPKRYTLVGIFHTHPYDRTEGSMNGVSFSSGDVVGMVNDGYPIDVVQSGPRLFVTLRTALTPARAPVGLAQRLDAEFDAQRSAGRTFQQASRIEMQVDASRLGMAYYQGRHGVVSRV